MSDEEWQRVYRLVMERMSTASGGDWASEVESIFYPAWLRGREDLAVGIAVTLAQGVAEVRRTGNTLPYPYGLRDGWLPALVGVVLNRERLSLTVNEAAAQMGCSPQHVRRLVRQGRIGGRMAPHGGWRCNAVSVITYRKRGS